MKHNQQENRHHANQEFLQSLELLSKMLEETVPQKEKTPELDTNTSEKNNHQVAQTTENSEIDLSIWEEAVADIERYLQDGT